MQLQKAPEGSHVGFSILRISMRWFHMFDYGEEESRFHYAVNVVLEHEGSLSKDKDDLGGTTNFGISLKYLQGIEPHVTSIDIERLTRAEAISIYRKHWWDTFHFGRIHDLTLATKTFDLSVNLGPTRGIKLLQVAINRLHEPQIEIDGEIASHTVGAIDTIPHALILDGYRQCAKEFYIEIIKRNPKFEKFRAGWMNRAAW